ncbi:hypothetical protein QUF80_11230 [Desulfococcaceae bacterium HSG8]|nr:hypothetical protein [Desulfococcaceae bacterium HSG8]
MNAVMDVIRKITDRVQTSQLIKVNKHHDMVSKDKNVEVTVRYSDRYSISVSSSVINFLIICLGLILTLMTCCILTYLFFYSIFMGAYIFGLCCLGALVWRIIKK